MAGKKHIPLIINSQNKKHAGGGSLDSILTTLKTFGSTQRDPFLGRDEFNENSPSLVDFLDVIDHLTDKKRDNYNPYNRIGLYKYGGHKYAGGSNLITQDYNITAPPLTRTPDQIVPPSAIPTKGMSLSQGLGLADSLFRIGSNVYGNTKLTTDYNEWSNKVRNYGDTMVRSFDDVDTNEGLLQAAQNTPLLGAGLRSRDFRNKSVLNDVGSALSAGQEGFMAGMRATANPVAGAVLGIGSAIASGLGSLKGRIEAKEAARMGNNLINKRINPQINLGLVRTGNKVDTINDRARLVNAMNIPEIGGYSSAYGGDLDTHGLDFDNGLTFIDIGGTHEENPYGGVFAGISADGLPNLVEQDEVIWDDYVFSNRINVPEKLAKKYKLGGKVSFAKAVRKITEPSMERPGDPISKDTNEAILTEFRMAQEEERAKREARRREMLNELIDTFAPEELPEETQAQEPQPEEVAPMQEQSQGIEVPEEQPVEEPPVPGFAEGGHLFAKGGPERTERENNLYKRLLDSGMNEQEADDFLDMVGGNELILMRLESMSDEDFKKNMRPALDEAVVTAERPKPFVAPTISDSYEFAEEPALDDDLWSELANSVEYKKDKKGNIRKLTIDGKPIKLRNIKGKTQEEDTPKAKRQRVQNPSDDSESLFDAIRRLRGEGNPVVNGSRLGALYNYLRGPQYENADAIIGLGNEIGAPTSFPVRTIGNYMQNKDFDSRYLVNLANANRAAAARAGMNTSAGNKAANLAYASSLAHNNQQELGDIARQAYLAERQDDSLVSQFNRGTDMTNMQAINSAAAALAQLNSQRQLSGADLRAKGFNARQNAWDYWDKDNGANFTQYLENLNAVQNEQKEKQSINSIAKLYGVTYNDDGTWSWEDTDNAKAFFDVLGTYNRNLGTSTVPATQKACGGKIKRKRRF